MIVTSTIIYCFFAVGIVHCSSRKLGVSSLLPYSDDPFFLGRRPWRASLQICISMTFIVDKEVVCGNPSRMNYLIDMSQHDVGSNNVIASPYRWHANVCFSSSSTSHSTTNRHGPIHFEVRQHFTQQVCGHSFGPDLVRLVRTSQIVHECTKDLHEPNGLSPTNLVQMPAQSECPESARKLAGHGPRYAW